MAAATGNTYGSLTITPAAAAVTGNSSSVTYNGATQSVTGYTVSTLQNGEDPATVLTGLSATGASGTNYGTYTNTVSGSAANGNYLLTFVNGALNIGKATVTLSATKPYDGNTDLTGYVTLATGIANESLTYSGATASSKNVADNAVNFISSIALLDGSGGLASNYQLPTPLSHSNASVTITPAPLSVISGSLTGTITKVYDGTNAATLTAANYLITGFFGSDGASVTKTSGNYDTANTGTGKTVTVSLSNSDYLGTGSTALSNYSLPTAVSGSIGTITPAPLTVKANNDTKVFNEIAYSGGNGVTFSGFVNNENSVVLDGTLTYSGNSQGAINTGSYVIIPAGYTARNYALNYVNGALTIILSQQRPVEIDPQFPSDQFLSVAIPPQVVGFKGESEGIIVQIVSEPSDQGPGTIAVAIPSNMAFPGSGFSFELPEKLISFASSSGLTETVTLLDGSALPEWLQYNPTSKTFTATNVQNVYFPLKVLVRIGDRSWILDLSVQLSA